MWHPFDIMQSAADVADDLRNAAAPAACKLVYSDRILARFPTKDKIGVDAQWKPAIDQLPGITIERRPAGENGWALTVEQRWQFAAVDHRMNASITTDRSPWRSPVKWTFQQTITPNAERPALAPLQEEGRWEGGKLYRQSKAGQGREETTRDAAAVTSFYSLLADFPTDVAKTDGTSVTMLGEGFQLMRTASLSAGHDVARNLPPARGLRNHLLQHAGGLPLEFWVNEAGAVVFVSQGPTRLLVLQSVEKLA